MFDQCWADVVDGGSTFGCAKLFGHAKTSDFQKSGEAFLNMLSDKEVCSEKHNSDDSFEMGFFINNTEQTLRIKETHKIICVSQNIGK